jgi:hypothetical protein
MTRTNKNGEIVEYVMEPEEELHTLRFLVLHRPLASNNVLLAKNVLWDPRLTLTEQAKELGLRGGYGVHFHGLHGGDFG